MIHSCKLLQTVWLLETRDYRSVTNAYVYDKITKKVHKFITSWKHWAAYLFRLSLCLCKVRLAGGGVMFLTCPCVRYCKVRLPGEGVMFLTCPCVRYCNVRLAGEGVMFLTCPCVRYCNVRLAGGGVMFLTCPCVRYCKVRLAGGGVMFVTCPCVRSSVTEIMNTIFWNWMNRFWCQLTQLVYGTRAWNGQLWGSGDKRSRSHKARIGHKNYFQRDISRTVWQIWAKPAVQ